jgi:prepilin-type N-terminal cleavage/methylation domain-containing protein
MMISIQQTRRVMFRRTPPAAPRRGGDAGFSLIEVMLAMGILATGLLSLAGVFTLGMRHLAGSSYNLLAREKAREAVESVHTARDTRVITWAQIKNVGNGGVFVDGPQPLRLAGIDGLVNTADDAAAGIEVTMGPGADNKLGTADDIATPLTAFTREIAITELLTAGVPNPSLRQLTVTIIYQVGGAPRTYRLTTFVSSIS